MTDRPARRLLPLLAALAAGCGGDAPRPPAPLDFGGPDGRAVADFLDQFNEHKHDPARVKQAFAGPPTAPAAGYDRYDFQIDGVVSVAGTTATARVRARPEAGSAEPVLLDWAFEKVGDRWKLKSAPLPGK